MSPPRGKLARSPRRLPRVSLLALVLGAGCASVRAADPVAPLPSGGWIEVAFAAPRAVRATWADGATWELENVTAVRGQLVATAGDTVTLRVDVGAGGIRIGAPPGPVRAAAGLRRVTLVRDADASVRQVRVSAGRTTALAVGVPLAVIGLVFTALVVAGVPLDPK